MALKGNLGFASRHRVRGWAFDPERPNLPVSLVVIVDGEIVARGLADRPRPDLLPALKASGRHGFDIRLHIPLDGNLRHIVEVRREEDGSSLPNSPFMLHPSSAFDEPAKSEWRAVLAAAETEADYEARLDFLLQQTAALRAAYARMTGGFEQREISRRLRLVGEAGGGEVGKPCALVVDAVMPDLRRDAGSNAIVSHITALQRLGFSVSFAPANLNGDAAALEALDVQVYRRPLVETVEALLQQQRNAYSVVYLHRAAIASNYLEIARMHQPRAKIVYSVADLHHLRLARQAAVEQRPELARHAETMRRRELSAAWAADAVITHSHAEALLLAKHVPAAKIFAVPWAVEALPGKTSFTERNGVAFLAGFGHSPNVDAAHELVAKIMPEVWRRDPTIKLLLVGSEMPSSLRALSSENVEIVGFAPDLAEVFARVRLTVAPLAYGAGLKGKVLESLAAGVPCVCTPVAAEGFRFASPLSDLIGADTDEFAKRVVSMHQDELANTRAAQAGVQFVKTFASADAVDEALARALGITAEHGRALYA